MLISAASAQTVEQFPDAQVQRLVPPAEVRPFVTDAAHLLGGQPVRRLKTVYTSNRTQVLAEKVIVQLPKGTTQEDEIRIHQDAAALGAGIAKPVLRFPEGYELVDVSGAVSAEAAMDAYRATRGVLAVSPSTIGKFAFDPSDQYLNRQLPSFDRIAVRLAWNRTQLAGTSLSARVRIAL